MTILISFYQWTLWTFTSIFLFQLHSSHSHPYSPHCHLGFFALPLLILLISFLIPRIPTQIPRILSDIRVRMTYKYIKVTCEWNMNTYEWHCTRVSSVCHPYALVCHSYVTRMCFYHGPNTDGRHVHIPLK